MNLREKLNGRMDQLQAWMESNHHLVDPDECTTLIDDKLSFAWEILSEEDRDYIQGSRYAIEKQMHWEVPSKETDQ